MGTPALQSLLRGRPDRGHPALQSLLRGRPDGGHPALQSLLRGRPVSHCLAYKYLRQGTQGRQSLKGLPRVTARVLLGPVHSKCSVCILVLCSHTGSLKSVLSLSPSLR